MPETEFTMIRHGQTAENIAGRLQGHFDTELDETGLLQARAAARRLAGERFDAFYSSDLKRAMMTAAAIAETIGMHPEPLKELREWHLGILEGRPCRELWEEYPEIMNCFKYESGEVSVPGGELPPCLWTGHSADLPAVLQYPAYCEYPPPNGQAENPAWC